MNPMVKPGDGRVWDLMGLVRHDTTGSQPYRTATNQEQAMKRRKQAKRKPRRLKRSDQLRTEVFFGMMHQALGLSIYQPFRYRGSDQSTESR